MNAATFVAACVCAALCAPLCAQAPPATTPPPATAPAAPAPDHAAPADSPPAAPQPAPLPRLDMASKGLEPRVDGMADLQPGVVVLAKAKGTVARVEPRADVALVNLQWRTDPESLSLVARSADGREVVIGQLRWRGTSLEWHWVRASATRFGAALKEAESMLPWATFVVTVEGGERSLLCAPPTQVERPFNPAFDTIVGVAGSRGRTLRVLSEPRPEWTERRIGDREIELSCTTGELRVRLDEAGQLRVESLVGGNQELTAGRERLRKLVAEQRAAPDDDEKRILQGEIDQLREELRRIEAAARVPVNTWPAVPALRVATPDGRDMLVLTWKRGEK